MSTNYDKPYELREFKFAWESFSVPKCVFCKKPSIGMTIRISITTAQDGFETSSGEFICKNCLTEIYNLCKDSDWVFNKKRE